MDIYRCVHPRSCARSSVVVGVTMKKNKINNKKEIKSISLICLKCKYDWEYRGGGCVDTTIIYTSCPKCLARVKLRETKTK